VSLSEQQQADDLSYEHDQNPGQDQGGDDLHQVK
jgi:hypothetical protein